jgi:hypothetical protein
MLSAGLRNFCRYRDRSRSVKKPFLFEIRAFQRIELNGFSSGGGNATKISPAGDFFGSFFIGVKMNTTKRVSKDYI